MQWLRAKRAGLGVVALLALALQLVTSFAHVHAPAQDGMRAFALTSLALSDDATADSDHPRANPSCDICATLQLGSVAELAHPPALVLPQVAAASVPFVAADVIVARRHSPAQSRAPPIA